MPVNKKDYPPNWPELTREAKAAAGFLQHIANRRYGRFHTREHQLRLEF